MQDSVVVRVGAVFNDLDVVFQIVDAIGRSGLLFCRLLFRRRVNLTREHDQTVFNVDFEQVRVDLIVGKDSNFNPFSQYQVG